MNRNDRALLSSSPRTNGRIAVAGTNAGSKCGALKTSANVSTQTAGRVSLELVRDAGASPARLHSGPAPGRRGSQSLTGSKFAKG